MKGQNYIIVSYLPRGFTFLFVFIGKKVISGLNRLKLVLFKQIIANFSIV
jgi:hypothetical protein